MQNLKGLFFELAPHHLQSMAFNLQILYEKQALVVLLVLSQNVKLSSRPQGGILVTKLTSTIPQIPAYKSGNPLEFFKMSCLITKPMKWHVRPAKTQISLGIRPVWSVFAVRIKKHWVLSYPSSAQQRLWSDWVDAQADLSLCWAQSFCWFSHKAAQVFCGPWLYLTGVSYYKGWFIWVGGGTYTCRRRSILITSNTIYTEATEKG